MNKNNQPAALNYSIRLSRTRAYIVCSIMTFRILLDYSYYHIVSNVWGYAKFTLHADIIKLIESYLLLLVISLFIPRSKEKISNVMFWVLFLTSYVPMLTLYALGDQSRILVYSVTGFWLLVLILISLPNLYVPLFNKHEAQILSISLIAIFASLVILLIIKNFNLKLNFNFNIVYEIRKQFVQMDIPLSGYLFIWVAKVLNPFLFILFFMRKKWIYSLLLLFFQLVLFSMTGNKGFFFSLPFVLILILIVKKNNPAALLAMGLSSIVLAGILSYFFLGDTWMTSLFTRRALLLPAQLNYFYYDYFSNHDYLYLSIHRIFNFFFEYPYQLEPAHLIADVYFGKPEMNANTGLIGDACMNFGLPGLVIWAFIVAIILKLADSFSAGKSMHLTIAAIAIPILSLRSSSLLTCIFTHGLLLSLLFIYLMPLQQKISYINNAARKRNGLLFDTNSLIENRTNS